MSKRKLQTFGEYEEAYYHEHPDKIDGYLKTIFEKWARHSQLRI